MNYSENDLMDFFKIAKDLKNKNPKLFDTYKYRMQGAIEVQHHIKIDSGGLINANTGAR